MIRKIISGGQTGADQAALDVAMAFAIPHGGFIPKGRKTEEGPLPPHYHLTELPSPSYETRTLKNVLLADGTLILSHGPLTGGSRLTASLAQKHGKPFLHLDLTTIAPEEGISRLSQWVHTRQIKVLNVAGSRASGDARIYAAVFEFLSLFLAPATNRVDTPNHF